MFIIQSAGDAVNKHGQAMASTIESAIRVLLEKKHLYQSIDCQVEKANEEFQKAVPKSLGHTLSFMKGAHLWAWQVQDAGSFQAMAASLAKVPEQRGIIWRIPDVKLFCKSCDRVEPFNGVSASNMLNRSNPASGGIYQNGKLVQVFCLSYLCQSCKGVPEVFLVRRAGIRLTNCGRSPIEHVPVPKTIPRSVAAYYSDAIVAHQSGQTLAGLFMLRTVCEQWTRQFSDASDKADVALEKYMNLLPEDFKARFPSLRTIYGDLSSAIHSAHASEELFSKTATQIEEHFSARSLFKLPPS